jgi:hypothetical protein
MIPNPELATQLLDRYGALKNIRSPWESLWSDIAKYVCPRRVPGLNGTVTSPTTQDDAILFDTTAVRANMTLANGQLAWMSPLESPWFSFEPTEDNDNGKQWLAKATNKTRNELATGNFYTSIHEFYLDRGAFGTACLYIEPGQKNLINAQIWPVGSFVVDEDAEGNVDTAMREFTLTARQAYQKFGEEYCSPKIKAAMKAGGAKEHDKFSFIHAVYPRDDKDRGKGKIDDVNMPIASVYIQTDDKHVCKVSGYEEMPVMVSRYLSWGSNTGGVYGWSPAFSALPEARQVNFMQKMMDALGEKAAFPPVLAPDDLEGEIDPNAYGVTYFSAELASRGAMPKEWMTQGRYDIGLDRIKERQKAIDASFHVELFQMFAQIEKQMTAREVAERSQEKLIQFSPTFARLTSELFNPMLARVFAIMFRSGRYGDVPPELANIDVQVQYSSRIALALRALPALGYQRTLERLLNVSQIAPNVLDNFDFDRAERDTALADGVSPEFLVSKDKVDSVRKARAEAQVQRDKMEQAAAGADALAKVGKVPSDSPVGQAIKEQLPSAA